MTLPQRADDIDLLAELGRAGRLDVPPPDIVVAVKAAFIWRTIDAELAELTYDSAVDEEALAGLRGLNAVAGVRSVGTGSRRLTFESPRLTVEIEIEAADASRRLEGQLVPPQPGRVEIRHGVETLSVEADALGRFSAASLSAGPVSLHCEGAEAGVSVTTDWVVV